MELKKKVIAVDIDGTLVTAKKEITKATKDVLARFQRSGGVLILASGRPPRGMCDFARELELEKHGGYLMSYNGSLVRNMKTGETVFKRVLDNSVIPKVMALAKSVNINMLTYQGDTIITEDDSDSYQKLERTINHLDLKIVDSMEEYIDFEIPKMLGTGEPSVLEGLEKTFKTELSNVSVFRSEPFFIEVNPKGISKGDVLELFLPKLGYTLGDLFAAGDGYNDITMIEKASVGVAMANARDAVKRAADYMTLSNDEDGFAKAVERFIFS